MRCCVELLQQWAPAIAGPLQVLIVNSLSIRTVTRAHIAASLPVADGLTECQSAFFMQFFSGVTHQYLIIRNPFLLEMDT